MTKGTIRRALYAAKHRHNYAAGGFPLPFQQPPIGGIPPLSQYQFYNGAQVPPNTPIEKLAAANKEPELPIKGDRAFTPMSSEGGGAGIGTSGMQDVSPIASSTSYGPGQTTTVSQAAPQDLSWTGDLSGAKSAFSVPDINAMSFAEGKSASMGPYGDLSGAKSAFANQQTDDETSSQSSVAGLSDSEDSSGGDSEGGSDSGGGDSGGGDSGGGDSGGGGGDGGGGGGSEKRGGRIYPLRHHTDWEEAHDYEKTGGELVHMSPDEYLKRVKPLNMDHDDHHIIHHFAKQMDKGEKFDPLAIYPDKHPNGRHRAHAAKKLGIKKVPVVIWPKKESVKRKSGGPVVDRALMLTCKKA